MQCKKIRQMNKFKINELPIINSIGNKNGEVRFWNFVEEDQEVELTIYGELVSQKSWWNDEGQITASDFKQELDQYKDKDNITVRINSNGGDVFTAAAIYTLLKDCKANITVKIDGMAMSAATVIAMAGDTVMIPSTSIFMIHDPLAGLMGYYNSRDLQKVINRLGVVKNTIVNAYIGKSSKTKEEIENLMTEELWLTGEDAVNEGFCDEVMFSENENNPVIDGNNLIINSVKIDLSNFNVSDKFKNKIKNITNKGNYQRLDSNIIPIQDTSFLNNKKGDDEMIKTVEELKNQYPEIYNQVVNSAKEEERKRIKDIDDLQAAGFEQITNKAKYEDVKDAGSCAMEIIKAQKQLGKDFLENREKDIEDSNVNKISAINSNQIKNSKYDDKEADALFDSAVGGIK